MLAVMMVVTETVNIRLIIFYYHCYHYYYDYHYDDDDVPDTVFNTVTKKPLSFLLWKITQYSPYVSLLDPHFSDLLF